MFPRENRNIVRVLGAEVAAEGGQYRPAPDQQFLSARVADVIEACCDEWLDDSEDGRDWQSGPLLAEFWARAATRLTDSTSYWSSRRPSAAEMYKIAMAYTARFDPDGRGATQDEDLWGFRLGDLTWGKRKAEIDVDLLAKPWVSTMRSCILS